MVSGQTTGTVGTVIDRPPFEPGQRVRIHAPGSCHDGATGMVEQLVDVIGRGLPGGIPAPVERFDTPVYSVRLDVDPELPPVAFTCNELEPMGD